MPFPERLLPLPGVRRLRLRLRGRVRVLRNLMAGTVLDSVMLCMLLVLHEPCCRKGTDGEPDDAGGTVPVVPSVVHHDVGAITLQCQW